MTFGGGTNKGTLNATTFTLAPSATGDFVVVAVVSESTTHYITGISSSNVTWSTLVAATTVGSDTATVFIGQVTSASSATVTLTFNSSTSTIRGHWTEFSTSVGYSSVTLDSSGIVNATTDNFPQLTPGHGSGELYFGFAVWPVSATAGSTSGYTYYVDATNDNGSCWNTSCTSSAQQPVWGGTAAAINGIAVLLYEAVTPITASGSVEMAAMALAGTGAETFTASGSMTAAPLALAGNGTGGNNTTTYVTATGTGEQSYSGIALQVAVLYGQAASPAGKTGTSSTATTPELAITPNATGSYVFGAIINAIADSADFTAAATTTFLFNQTNSSNPATFGAFYSTSETTASTPVTLGATAPAFTADYGSIALLEILAASGALTIASTPTGELTGTGDSVSTGLFSVSGTDILVAMVTASYAGDVISVGVADELGLTWTQQSYVSTANGGYAGVWTAVVPNTVGSGSLALAALALSGTAAETFTGSGSLALAALALSGTAAETFTGSGSLALAALALSGTAAETFTGSGSLALAPLALHGTGAEAFTSAGSLASSPLALAAAAAGGDTAASGSAALDPGALSGTALAVTTYYVSTSGSDSNNGTSPSTPWQTVAKVNGTALNPGDSVLFEGGQTWTGTNLYLTSAGTAGNPVTIGSYGTGRATLSMGSNDGIYAYNVGGYVIENLNVTGISGSTGYNGIEFYAYGTGQLPAITVQNCGVTGWKYGILIGGYASDDGWNGVTLSGNDTSGNVYAGVLTYGTTFNPASPAYNHANVLVENCTANDNTGNASDTSQWSGSGIVLGSVSGGLVTGSTAHGNGADNASSSGPVGIWTYASSSVTIEYCVAYDNATGSTGDGDGFDIDVDCTGCVIQYCISYGNAGAGVLCWGGTADTYWGSAAPNVVRWNICWGNGTNGAADSNYYGDLTIGGNLSGLEAYGNTCVSQTTGSAQPAPFANPTADTLSGVTVRNNIFYCGSTDDVIVAASAYTTGELLFQGNCYYSTGTFGIYWGGTGYSSLSAWRTATGQEVLSASSTGLQASPGLKAPATIPAVTSPSNLAPADGLQLVYGSPCAGAGLDLLSLFGINPGTRDFFGATLTVPLPIGASANNAAAGSLTLAPLALHGTGNVPGPVTMTGSIAAAPLALAGTGGDTSCAGSVTLPPLALSGTGAETFAATGSLALAPLALAGTAAGGDTAASGTLALAPPALHGTGTGDAGAGTGLLMAIWP